jgi:hypothetical protein
MTKDVSSYRCLMSLGDSATRVQPSCIEQLYSKDLKLSNTNNNNTASKLNK